jgi:RNA ligase
LKVWNYIKDTGKLEQYIESGLVRCQYHKQFNDLMILTYGRKAVYENVWDEITEKCRGLIVNFVTGDIVARPFEKFHNIMTADRTETHLALLPKSDPIVTEKLDGSLGIAYFHRGVHSVASKGSFHSEHAKWATHWYRCNVPDPVWPTGYTPIFEMICESVQHHVCHYGWEGLVLLALINNETGEEMRQSKLDLWAGINGLSAVANFASLSPEQAIHEDRPNKEGYVLSWPREKQPPFRVKVKFKDFLRLQRIVHDATPRRIFESLAAGGSYMLEQWQTQATPQLGAFVSEWKRKLEAEYLHIFQRANQLVREALLTTTTRKETAAFFLREENKFYASVCFAILDEKDYGKPIWKLVEPMVKTAKPFISEDELVTP